MDKVLKTITLWLWGGCIYYLMEIIWRGHSHPSMYIVGGICFLLIGGINNWFPWSLGLIWQTLIGTAAVAVVEFISGVILNIWLKLDVWNYCNLPFNILGQICLYFVIAWIPLTMFAVYLDDFLRWKLYADEKPHYTLL